MTVGGNLQAEGECETQHAQEAEVEAEVEAAEPERSAEDAMDSDATKKFSPSTEAY
jgi:hypothetical protein